MVNDVLVEAFARLSTSLSKQDALEALIRNLTPYEWRFVQSLISTRAFQLDIIGCLPVELVAEVFSYLDTTTPWRLQHVSHAWYEKLRSLAVLKSSLESLYNGTINLQGVDPEFCRKKARSIQAFRTGLAPPDIRWRFQHQKHQALPFLAGDNLIWIAEGRRQVNIVNMRSMTSRTLVDPSRGEIDQVYAADDLVIFSSRGRGVIFAGELNDRCLVKRFRIQSSRSNLVLTCRRRTAACAMHLETHTQVYIWDFDSSRCRSFEINRAALQTPMLNDSGLGLLLQPNTETVLLCQFSDQPSSEKDHTTLLHWRFSFAGACLRGDAQELERCDKRGESGSIRHISGLTFIPVSYNGLYMLQCEIDRRRTPPAGSLQYDDNIEAFTSPKCPVAHPINTRSLGDVYWWKDVFVETGANSDIIVHRGSASVPNPGANAARTPGQGRELQDLLINDKYIVRPFDDSIDVLCYDHTVQLPGATGSLPGIGPWEIIEHRTSSKEDRLQAS